MAKFQLKRHTLISRTPHGLGFPPRAISRSGLPRGEPAVSDATTGLNLSIFRFPPHDRPSDRGQLSLPDVNYTKFTGLKSQCETQTYHAYVRCPSSFALYDGAFHPSRSSTATPSFIPIHIWDAPLGRCHTHSKGNIGIENPDAASRFILTTLTFSPMPSFLIAILSLQR